MRAYRCVARASARASRSCADAEQISSFFLKRFIASHPEANAIECRRGKGQHLLKNHFVIEAIVEKARLRDADTVLEIGAGTGNLTLCLLEKVKKVIAIEVDKRMVEELERRAQQTEHFSKLEVVQGDIMKMDLPDFDICVANIPYQMSSPLIFKLLSCSSKFRAAVLMLQKEFAKRLTAKSGDPTFCRLSVNTQLLATVDLLMDVRKDNFSPPPKVDSSVVCIKPNPVPLPVNIKEWDGLIRLCFSRKNKTLGAIFRQKNTLSMIYQSSSVNWHSICKKYCCINHYKDTDNVETKCISQTDRSREQLSFFKERVLHVLKKGDFEEKRSVKLKQEDFLRLLLTFNEAGIHFNFGDINVASFSPL